MAEGPTEDAVAAWRAFCDRMGDAGEAALRDEVVGTDRELAEGLRHLARQLTFAAQQAIEFDDPAVPRFSRGLDDVIKWGGPNADNNYYRCRIDPAGTYRVTADVSGCRELIMCLTEGDMQLGQFGVFGECSLRDIEVPEGRLELVISPEHHDGNWIESDPSARYFSIRVYSVDWTNDPIPDFAVERVDLPGAAPAPLTVERVASQLDVAADWVERSVPFWSRYQEGSRASGDNVLRPPATPPGGADNIAYGGGYWNLADDEAWVVTFETPDAFHWSIQTHTWPWFESGELGYATTSYNDEQAHVDTDGRVRVVVSHRDPGTANWLDTEGRPVGMCVYRWIWTASMPVPDGVVVPFAEVRDHLPDDHPVVDVDARRAELDERRRAVHRRFRR